MKRIRLLVYVLFSALMLVTLSPLQSRAVSQDELMEKIRLLEVQIQQLKEMKAQQRLSEEKEQHCFTAVGEKNSAVA